MSIQLTRAQTDKICTNLSLTDLNDPRWYDCVVQVATKFGVKPEAVMFRPTPEQYFLFRNLMSPPVIDFLQEYPEHPTTQD